MTTVESPTKTTLRVIIAKDGAGGWYMRSPQIPRYTFGRPTRAEFDRDLEKELSWAALNLIGEGEYAVRLYEEFVFDAADGTECAVLCRFADGSEDSRGIARQYAATALVEVLQTEDEGVEELLRGASEDSLGRVCFVNLLADDALRDAAELFDDATPRLRLNHTSLGPPQYFSGVELARSGETPLAALGLSLDSTMADAMAAVGRSLDQPGFAGAVALQAA